MRSSQLEGATGLAQMSVLGDNNTQEDAMSGPCRLRVQVLLIPLPPPGPWLGRKQQAKLHLNPAHSLQLFITAEFHWRG